MTDPRDLAKELARGVARALAQRGFATLAEVPLANGRRADLLALGRDGILLIVEIKSSLADFRSDRKWPDYRAFCDRLSFAVPADFPHALIPEDCGLIVADPFGALILREGVATSLSGARRKAVTLRFARLAASRMQRLTDPAALAPEPG
ncbi:MAG TPA: MmcB family DNA repair protein [Stellaceae bacterium]|nr:MmcB family DNA repair protein [Stellaceae bacterium]